MTIQQLRALVAIVAHGGFRAAARALNVSQGGLTKTIASLEEEYKVDFFDRNAKGVLLTPQGEAFLPLARAILEESDRAERWLKSFSEGGATSVALGASVEPSVALVPSVLSEFRRAMPQVTVRLTQGVSTEILAGLRENRVELAITKLPRNFDSTDLRVEKLYRSDVVVVARVGHPKAKATSIRELLEFDWLVIADTTEHGADKDDSIWDLFDREGLPHPRFSAVCSSLLPLLSILLESDALARVPRAVIEHVFFAKCLVEVPLRTPSSASWVALVSKASRRLTAEGQMLSAMLASYARVSQGVRRQ